jgi:hypothetical protein
MVRILIVFIILGSIGYWYWTRTPEYSIEKVKQSIKQHDLVTFQKYVDMDSVASGIVDDLLAAPMRHLLGPGILGQWVVAGIVGVFKRPLADGIKDDISHFVTTGELVRSEEGSETEPKRARLSLGSLDGRFGFRKHAFRRVEYDLKNGSVCTLGLLLHNEVYNQDLVLDVKMRESGGFWRVFELSNLPAFTGKLVELESGSHDGSSIEDDRRPREQL